jgi:hypothetical protein
MPLLVLMFRGIRYVYQEEIQNLEVTQEAAEDFHRHVKKVKRRRAEQPYGNPFRNCRVPLSGYCPRFIEIY